MLKNAYHEEDKYFFTSRFFSTVKQSFPKLTNELIKIFFLHEDKGKSVQKRKVSQVKRQFEELLESWVVEEISCFLNLIVFFHTTRTHRFLALTQYLKLIQQEISSSAKIIKYRLNRKLHHRGR